MKVTICMKVTLLNKTKIIISKYKNTEKCENSCLLWNIQLTALRRPYCYKLPMT